MPNIDIRRPHHLSVPEARAVVDRVAAGMQARFGMTGQWQDNAFRFSRSGAKGTITVGEDDVHVLVELGFLLSAMKGMIDQEIRQKLDEHFG